MSVPSQLSLSNTRGTSVVKKYFSKFTMLIIAALSIVSVVLGFLSGGISLSLILSGVVAAMITLIYFTCKGNGNPKLFFGVLHVMSLIEFIGFILIGLLCVVAGFTVVVAPTTILNYMKSDPDAFNNALSQSGITFDMSQSTEEMEAALSAIKVGLLIGLLVIIAVIVVIAIFISAQTTFLRSCKKSCKGTGVYYDGASGYGTLSMVVGFIYLVFIVIGFLIAKSGESGIEGLGEETATFSSMAVSPLVLVTNIVSAVSILLRGTFAKGWIAWAKENQAWVEDGNVAANVGPASANAMNTFKSTQRKSNDAIHQSQAYTYGTEDDSKNQSQQGKKSEYIPEELQNDYPPQYDQNMGGMMNDPFMGDPFAPTPGPNPYGQDPFGADPFAADPFAQQPPMGGNPYGAPNPGEQGYNNGMM